jgi:glycosyltransferase involved in cell wall biosynthesis
MPGFLEGREKERALLSSDVFVLPSHQENFGVAAVEAMAAGLPVLISRGVGIWREVEQAEAGLVVERTARGVASALTSLLADPDRRKRLGTNGRSLVRDRFAPEAVGRRLLKLYSDAARTRDPDTSGQN